MSDGMIIFLTIVVIIAVYAIIDRVCTCLENRNMSKAFNTYLEGSHEGDQVDKKC